MYISIIVFIFYSSAVFATQEWTALDVAMTYMNWLTAVPSHAPVRLSFSKTGGTVVSLTRFTLNIEISVLPF